MGVYTHYYFVRNLGENDMRNLICAAIVTGILTLVLVAGCTFNLKGLNATDGDKTLNVESLETTE